MVTLIDSQFFGYFNSVFVFLAVLLVVFGILSTMKLFGDHGAFINAILAVAVAIIFASSSFASRTFELATPWIVMLLIVLLFINIVFKFMDAGSEMQLGKHIPIMTVLLILVVVIFILSAGQAGKEQSQKLADKGVVNPVLTFPQQVGETLRHPAVLGLIMVLLIATFATMLLSKPFG